MASLKATDFLASVEELVASCRYAFPSNVPKDYLSTDESLTLLSVSGNNYVNNRMEDVGITFKTVKAPHSYVSNTSYFVEDLDFIFPDPEDVDLGPEENDNSYELIP